MTANSRLGPGPESAPGYLDEPEPAPVLEVSGARSPARSGKRRNLGWLGLLPFFLYVTAFFLLPTGTVLFAAFRKTDPSTQTTSFTGENVSTAMQGVYLTAIKNSLTLALVTGVLGGLVGLLLAWAIVNSRGNLLTRLVSTAAAVLANFGGVPLAFLFIATVGNSGLLTTSLADHLNIN